MVMDLVIQSLRNEELEAIVSAHQAERERIQLLTNYWEGEQSVRLTRRMKRYLERNGADFPFRINYCDVVVSSMVERMNLTGFTVPGEEGTDGDPGPLAQFAADTWNLNRGDALQHDVHSWAAALGDSYLIVEWDEEAGHAVFHHNSAELVHVEYDPADSRRMTRASKVWTMKGPDGKDITRLNLYYPDRIERYIRDGLYGGEWRQFTDLRHPDWPIDNTDPDTGDPLGIMVVHFANGRRSRVGKGRSELDDVIPIQDALNKAFVDGVRTSDSQGWPQNWATGVSSTEQGDIDANPGSVWTVKDSDARFGQLPAADPAHVIAWLEKLESSAATISKTPQHLFRIAGGYPSGEALRTAESSLVRKVGMRQVSYGNAWEDAMVLAVRLAQANGVTLPDLPPTGYSAQWESAETSPSEVERINAINLKQGISTRQRLIEYGYTDEEIARITAEHEDERDELAETLGQAFDRGEGRAPERGRADANAGNEGQSQ